MQGRGFEETQSQYAADDPRALTGTCHRIGHYGPAYEVIAIKNDRVAKITLLETGEEVEYSIEDILTDPHPDEDSPPLS
jgi:Family of unknown function (DUF5397)